MLVRMMHGCLSPVMDSMLRVPVRYVGVMTSLFVICSLVMLGSFTMVFCCVFVMFRCLVVVFRTFVCRHFCLSAFQE